MQLMIGCRQIVSVLRLIDWTATKQIFRFFLSYESDFIVGFICRWPLAIAEWTRLTNDGCRRYPESEGSRSQDLLITGCPRSSSQQWPGLCRHWTLTTCTTRWTSATAKARRWYSRKCRLQNIFYPNIVALWSVRMISRCNRIVSFFSFVWNGSRHIEIAMVLGRRGKFIFSIFHTSIDCFQLFLN